MTTTGGKGIEVLVVLEQVPLPVDIEDCEGVGVSIRIDRIGRSGPQDRSRGIRDIELQDATVPEGDVRRPTAVGGPYGVGIISREVTDAVELARHRADPCDDRQLAVLEDPPVRKLYRSPRMRDVHNPEIPARRPSEVLVLEFNEGHGE